MAAVTTLLSDLRKTPAPVPLVKMPGAAAAMFTDTALLAIAPFFVGDARAPRFVHDGTFPWNPGHRARLAGVTQIEDVVLLRYALSDRYDGH